MHSLKCLIFEGVYFCLKSYGKLLKLLSGVCCLVLSLSFIFSPLVTYASVSDLFISTDSNAFYLASGSNAIASNSNAIMTLELDDDDYGVSTYASMGSCLNTISSDSLNVSALVYDSSGSTYYETVTCKKQTDGRYKFSLGVPNDHYIDRFFVRLTGSDLPPAGAYSFSFDYSSHIGHDVVSFWLYSVKNTENAAQVTNALYPEYLFDSGDIFCTDYDINLTNIQILDIQIKLHPHDYETLVGGSFAINFTPIESGDYPSTAGTNTSTSDYQSDVSSSLSGISSGMAQQAESIQNVADAISNLSASMEPHYGEVLTQLHHITEQLHAFWDQQYNLHHVPLMAKLESLVSALTNMDNGLGGKIDALVSAVTTHGQNIYNQLNTQRGKLSSELQNKMQAVQEALQSTLNDNTTTLFDQMFDQRNKLDSHIKGYVSEQTDTLTGGYDNSGMESDKSELDDAMSQYEQVEDELFEDAKGYINDFEFDTPFDAFTGPLSDISYFLSGMFSALGPMNVVITFSLTLTIAMVMIGWYRFKGGR